MSEYRDYADWLSNQPTDDTWPEWHVAGMDAGYIEGPPEPQPEPADNTVNSSAGAVIDAPADAPPVPVDMPAIADLASILDAVAETVAGMGVAGEARAVKLVYLTATTRLLDKIVSLVVKGPSSAGKSYLIESVLRLFPESACHVLSAFSERALIYDDAPLAHRMLVIYEAAGMAGDLQTYIVRSLLSEGCVRYITVEKGKDGLKPRTIERQGPTGLITSTTAIHLHPENETRMLSMTISDSSEQTAAVLLMQADGVPMPPDLEPWVQLQDWLSQGGNAVVIPYAGSLARAIPPVAVRLRRDFPTLIALVKAHALLHQQHRDRDADGAVVATIEDYAVVRELVADLIAEAVEQSVPETVRETVAAVSDLTLSGGETTVTKVADALKLEKSAASRRIKTALSSGYIKNEAEKKRGTPYRLVMGDPLPSEQVVLPPPEVLQEVLQCCSAPVGGSDSEARTGVSPARGKPDATPTATPSRYTPPDDVAALQHPPGDLTAAAAATFADFMEEDR